MYKCRFCEAQHPSTESLVKHEIAFHQFDANFTITCDQKNCPATFSNVSTYYSHRSRHKKQKRNIAEDLNAAHAPREIDEVQGEEHVEAMNVEIEEQVIGGDDTSDDDGRNMLDLAGLPVKEISGRLLLNLRANSSMPLSVLDTLMVYTDALITASLSQYSKDVKELLIQNGILPETLEMPSPVSNAFEGLETVYKQDKYFNETYNMVNLQVIELCPQQMSFAGTSMDSNRSVNLKPASMVYIPIIETLQYLLQNNDIQKVMNAEKISDSGKLESYVDGLNFKDSPFFKQHPDALRIILYYDDLELCDPLGSRAGKYSVGVAYMALENIPAKFRSCLRLVHLVGIALTNDIAASGIDKFLEPIVKDIKRLEQGVTLNGNIVYGCLIAFTGDNAAVHAVGGFKEGFTASHPCRTCLADLNEVRTSVTPDDTLLRTNELYNEQVRLLDEAASKQERSQLSSQFGINRRSILSDLEYFSVVKNLPPDAMHDLFEGCVNFTIKLLLKKIIDDKIMTLDEINNRIRDFDYGYSQVTSKPSAEIKSQHLEGSGKLRQSAAQMWLLAFVLPLIIGPFIDDHCDYWDVFLNLLQASAVIMSRKLSDEMLEFLRVKVTQYSEGFLQYYRDSLIPKQHYLLHYVHYIVSYGPISQFWSMRMEARHQFFKRIARKIRNFKNITLSLAKRNQLWEASQRNALFKKTNVTLCGPGTEMARNLVAYKDVLPLNFATVVQVQYVEINNLYLVARKCCLAVDFDAFENEPVFAYLVAVIMRDATPLLVCQKMKMVCFDVHLNSYEVELCEGYMLHTFESIFCQSEVFHWHVRNGKKYIFVRRALGPLF